LNLGKKLKAEEVAGLLDPRGRSLRKAATDQSYELGKAKLKPGKKRGNGPSAKKRSHRKSLRFAPDPKRKGNQTGGL